MSAGGKTVAVIGLGLMGTALSQRLLEHGFQVVVWNRTREKAESLIASGARWSDTPLRDCDRAIISLYASDVVREVLDAMQSDLHQGQILIDTTTGEPEDAEQFYESLKQCGVDYMDAPISGSSEQTRRGDALVMVGGESTTFERCRDLWTAMGKQVLSTGRVGSAARMKLISNLVLGLNRAALAEGLSFAKALGVDMSAALSVLKASAAYSRVMDIKGQKMLTNDFTLQARLSQHLKDVRLILENAQAHKLKLPLSETHRSLLEHAETLGYGEQDNSAVIRVYQESTDD